jgi:hypothetical protein
MFAAALISGESITRRGPRVLFVILCASLTPDRISLSWGISECAESAVKNSVNAANKEFFISSNPGNH